MKWNKQGNTDVARKLAEFDAAYLFSHGYDLEYESAILKQLFLTTIGPLILLEVSTAGSDFINSLVISQFFGPIELAVQGLAGPYFSIIGVVSGLLVTGMQTLCSKAYGSGEIDRVNGIFSLAAIVGGAISVLMTLAFVFFGGPIGEALGAVGEAAELLPTLKQYLIGLGLATPALVMFTLLMPLVQMDGGDRVAKMSVTAGFIINVVMDIVVAFLGGGMLGIGLAVAAARWSSFVILLLYAIRPKSSISFVFKEIAWAELGGMVAMGLPKAIRRVANMLRPIFLNRLVLALGGSAAMSAMSIRNSLDGMGDVVGSGIAAAVMLLVGVLYGEENREGILQISKLTLQYVFLWVGGVALVFFVGAPWLAEFYSSGDTAVATFATFAIRCMAVNLVLNAIIEAYINYLQATEQAVKTHIVNVASRFACVVACSYLLGSLFGINGVWLGFPVGSIALICGVVLITMVRKRSIVLKPDDFLDLPEDFGAKEEDTLRYCVTSAEEGYQSKTKDIYDFCDAHGLDRGKAYRTALCLEEMVTNIVDHGFTKDDKPHSIDVRIVAKGDDLILRVRDDCILFNVREKGEEWREDPKNIADNIGIRMTMAAAKDLKYVNTLGTNTLIITI